MMCPACGRRTLSGPDGEPWCPIRAGSLNHPKTSPGRPSPRKAAGAPLQWR
jgi:hypothetical protein